MRKLFLYLVISMLTLGFFVAEAEAARFGGGKSFGMSRALHSNGTFNAGSAARSFQAAPKAGVSKWLGPLAGFAAGGLLASLFMGHGLGSGIFSWLLIGGLVFFIWRFISNRLHPASQPTAASAANNLFQYQPAQHSANSPFVPAAVATTSTSGFDEAEFLRQAKTVFIRLQADYDNKNSNDIREFTTPEVFAEIQLQLQERGDALNQTEVVTINAELQDMVTESKAMIVSVLFSGVIREQSTSAPITIKEIWHFTKNENDQNWLVAGIQQHS